MDHIRSSLLEALQGIIERTFDLETGVRDIGRYVIGDEGYLRIYGAAEARGGLVDRVGAASQAPDRGARTLVRQFDGGLAVSVYYPDRLIECLEHNDPTRGLDDANVDAFAVLVEELDHLLVIAERYRSRGVISLLDLELHANVTKYLVLKMFVGKLRRTPRLSAADADWIWFHLFGKADFAEPDPEVNDRYRTAARLAARYVRLLDRLPAGTRPGELRRFHRLSPQGKIARIAAGC